MNIVDLFSGAGGLTFGFYYRKRGKRFIRNRKFNFLFANEYDPQAASAFRYNFPDIPLFERDITSITAEYIQQKDINIQEVDLVIGGPPCQSYSTVGKRQYDQRAKMYKEYIRLLGIIRPKMFIFENVTGLMSMKNKEGNPVIDDITQMFQDIHGNQTLGYNIHKKRLNAKDYGVPQSRERIFLVGTRNDLSINWDFPVPTHGNETSLKPYLTVECAIEDLPHLSAGQKQSTYNSQPKNDYAELMRGNSETITDHIAGEHGEKMKAVMKAVIQGEGRHYINSLVGLGKLKKEYYLTSGYANTYGRLWWDRPSTTITNSLGSPSSLRCIHPLDDRALTTREGARLQSFPDWFSFFGKKYEKNSQVGNAVPPLLAIELAKCISRSLKE